MSQVHNSVIGTPGRISPAKTGKVSKPVSTQDGASFDEVLRRQMSRGSEKLRFSGHALQRISQRNMAISPSDLEKIRSGVEAAREKGARDTLLVYKDHAFVVSVENRTVITARPMDDLSVYTKIDSAVVIGRDRPV